VSIVIGKILGIDFLKYYYYHWKNIIIGKYNYWNVEFS